MSSALHRLVWRKVRLLSCDRAASMVLENVCSLPWTKTPAPQNALRRISTRTGRPVGSSHTSTTSNLQSRPTRRRRVRYASAKPERPLLASRDGLGRRPKGCRAAGLHFDEDHSPGVLRDHIQFAPPEAHVPVEDPVAARLEGCDRSVFAHTAHLLSAAHRPSQRHQISMRTNCSCGRNARRCAGQGPWRASAARCSDVA